MFDGRIKFRRNRNRQNSCSWILGPNGFQVKSEFRPIFLARKSLFRGDLTATAAAGQKPRRPEKAPAKAEDFPLKHTKRAVYSSGTAVIEMQHDHRIGLGATARLPEKPAEATREEARNKGEHQQYPYEGKDVNDQIADVVSG